MTLFRSGDEEGKILIVFRIIEKRQLSHFNAAGDLKRQKLATTAPSTLAHPSVYEDLQRKSSQRILDDRPLPDADIPPIPLLYDGFGHFLDIVDGSTIVPGYDAINLVELHRAVDNFAEKMTSFYHNEDARRDAALPALNIIFAARTGTTIPPFSAAVIGAVKTDGHNVGGHGAIVTVTEFTNQKAGTNAVPEVKMTAYVDHSHVLVSSEKHKLFNGWRVPSLGLTIVGPDIKFYAIILVGVQYRLVNMTGTLSCIRNASDGRDRKILYKAFTAASVLQAHII